MGTQRGGAMEHSIDTAEAAFKKAKARYHRHLGRLDSVAMARKVRAGDLPGQAPTGYRNVRIRRETFVEVDPVLGSLLVETFHLAAKQRTSLRQILAVLTPKGLVSRQGKSMHASALRGILTNPFYIGFIRYQGQLHRGNHQPLVSPALFERVQHNLRKRRR